MKYRIEVEYTVTESIEVDAASVEAAEEKALEMCRLGVTGHNIVGDTMEEAEITSSGPADEVES